MPGTLHFCLSDISHPCIKCCSSLFSQEVHAKVFTRFFCLFLWSSLVTYYQHFTWLADEEMIPCNKLMLSWACAHLQRCSFSLWKRRLHYLVRRPATGPQQGWLLDWKSNTVEWQLCYTKYKKGMAATPQYASHVQTAVTSGARSLPVRDLDRLGTPDLGVVQNRDSGLLTPALPRTSSATLGKALSASASSPAKRVFHYLLMSATPCELKCWKHSILTSAQNVLMGN